MQFGNFCKEIGVCHAGKDEYYQSCQQRSGAKVLSTSEIDLLFQRANMTNLQKVKREGRETTDLGVNAEAFMDALELADVDTSQGDGGQQILVMHEFIHALIRLSWTCYPSGKGGKSDHGKSSANDGIGERMRKLLEQGVMPGSEHLMQNDDAFEAELYSSKRVKAITDYYKEFLMDVFQCYSRSDVTLNQKAGHLQKLNFAEVIFMCKEGQLLDEQLSLVRMTSLFVKTNALGETMGDDDEGGLDELTFEEYTWLLARIANAKFPNRNGEPFSETWKSFLQLIFVPRFRKLLKAKKQGSGRITIDGARF